MSFISMECNTYTYMHLISYVKYICTYTIYSPASANSQLAERDTVTLLEYFIYLEQASSGYIIGIAHIISNIHIVYTCIYVSKKDKKEC